MAGTVFYVYESMTENEIYKAINEELIAGLTERQINVTVKRNYQPTQQGVNFNPTIYMYFISHHLYGHLKRADVIKSDVIEHIESQPCETVIQFTGQVIEKPTVIEPTSLDIVTYTHMILQSSKTLKSLRDKGIEIYRPTDIRQVYPNNEQDRYQSTPSFDLTITHQHQFITTSPLTHSIEINKYRI